MGSSHCFIMAIYGVILSAAFASVAASTTDCTMAYQVLTAQMDDMQAGTTKVAFQLASPGNRAATASPDGYNELQFDRMVRSANYGALLSGFGYEVKEHGNQGQAQYAAKVRVFQDAQKRQSTDFAFVMSLQPTSLVDEDAHLGAFRLSKGHPPEWRTDRVMPVS